MDPIASLPTLITVITTAAIDSINPCAIGVMILMISAVLSGGNSRKRLFFLGMTYISAVMLVYIVAGMGLLYFVSSVPLFVVEYLSILVAVIIAFAAVLEIKDYFWYQKGMSLHINPKYADKITKMSKRTSTLGVFLLGAFVSAVELPCTGAPYLAIIALLSTNFNMMTFFMLLLYNIIFVAPLFIILILVLLGVKLQDIKMWKQTNRGTMRLFIGLTLIALAWLLIFISVGIINFG